MSGSLIKKMSLTIACGTVLGAGAAWSLVERTEPIALDRRVASLGDELKAKPPLMMGKHLSVVQVSIQTPEGIADRDDQDTKLVGWIRLNQPVENDLKYRWELPAGVHVVSGNPEDTIASLKNGETAKIELTVTGFSKEDLDLISLHGFVESGEMRLGNSAVITSRPQDSFEMLSGIAAGISAAPKKRALLKGKILR